MRTSSKPMPRGMKFFVFWIFPLVFVVIGATVAFFGFRGLIRAKASKSWPSTQGLIVSSSVERNVDSGSNGSGTTYHAKILYKFTVNGTTFNGDRVAYGDYGSSNSSHAYNIVNKYPEGKIVTVHYMPGNPEESLLEPGIKGQAFFLPGFGLIFLVVGTLMFIFLPRQEGKQEIIEETHEPDSL